MHLEELLGIVQNIIKISQKELTAPIEEAIHKTNEEIAQMDTEKNTPPVLAPAPASVEITPIDRIAQRLRLRNQEQKGEEEGEEAEERRKQRRGEEAEERRKAGRGDERKRKRR